jgi:DnaJ-domain-containing protein 1
LVSFCLSDPNSFALFGFDARFEVNREQLKERFHRMMTEVHPDRHVSGTAPERRNAVQWASRINQAYTELSHPLARAKLLCSLAGVPIDPARHPVAPEFLSQMLVWREHLEDIVQAIQTTAPGLAPGTLSGKSPGKSSGNTLGKSLDTPLGTSTGETSQRCHASARLNALYDEVLAAQTMLIEAFAASEVGRGARNAHTSQPNNAADLVVQWMLAERIVADCAQHRDALAEATAFVSGSYPKDCSALHAD